MAEKQQGWWARLRTWLRARVRGRPWCWVIEQSGAGRRAAWEAVREYRPRVTWPRYCWEFADLFGKVCAQRDWMYAREELFWLTRRGEQKAHACIVGTLDGKWWAALPNLFVEPHALSREELMRALALRLQKEDGRPYYTRAQMLGLRQAKEDRAIRRLLERHAARTRGEKARNGVYRRGK